MVNTGANDLNRVSIKDDLDLKKIADSGQCFRIKPLDDDSFRFVHMGHVLDMKHVSRDEFEISCSEEEFADVWHEYFDLDRDYRKIRKGINRNDDYLGRVWKGNKDTEAGTVGNSDQFYHFTAKEYPGHNGSSGHIVQRIWKKDR